MIKNIFLAVMALLTFGLAAEAQYGYPRPYPRPYPPPHFRPYPPVVLPYPTYPTYPTYPVPSYPVPVMPYMYTCNAIGLVNGIVSYGIGSDIYTASQRALFVCQSTGQVCQIVVGSCR